jgi:hypothetical protein
MIMAGEQELRERFLRYATDFSDAAKRIQQSGQHSNQVIGHLNWTATELSVKALAVGHSIPMTHDLDLMTKHLVDNGVLTDSEYNYLKPLYAHITGSATSYDEARYPSTNPTFWDTVTKPQMDQALQDGSAVQVFVRNRLRIEM